MRLSSAGFWNNTLEKIARTRPMYTRDPFSMGRDRPAEPSVDRGRSDVPEYEATSMATPSFRSMKRRSRSRRWRRRGSVYCGGRHCRVKCRIATERMVLLNMSQDASGVASKTNRDQAHIVASMASSASKENCASDVLRMHTSTIKSRL